MSGGIAKEFFVTAPIGHNVPALLGHILRLKCRLSFILHS